MIYKIEKRINQNNGTWSSWFDMITPKFTNRNGVERYFDNQFNELKKCNKMWRVGNYMGDEGCSFEYRIINSKGDWIK
jgi:hypothetical protein